MQIPNNSNKNKNLNGALIIMIPIMITIAIFLILNNAEIQISKQEGPKIKASYSAIENNTWDISENGDGSVLATLSQDGTLTIFGTGKMKDYGDLSNNPQWFEMKDKVKSVIIEDGVTNIGWYAFSRCTNLTNIEISNSVTDIGYCAFQECTSLTTVKIPNSITEIRAYTFMGCTNLTNIEIPNSVTIIGGSAFRWCTSLTSIEIPNSVTLIGEYAFEECTSLTSIEIPNSVTSIAWYAFARCTSLNNIRISNGVISIGEGTFQSCTSLTSIKFPNSITSIGNYMFDGCSNLTSIEVEENNKNYMDYNGVLYTKDGSEIIRYPEGKKEKVYTILPGTTSIGHCAFEKCTELTNIVIPDSVTNIIESALYGCTNLTSIKVEENNKNYMDYNGVLYTKDGSEIIKYPSGKKENIYTILTGTKNIRSYTFEECPNLISIEIPNTITSIDWFAFYECTNLTNIVIPNSVTDIGGDIFFRCPNLTIYCTSNSYAKQYATKNRIKYVTDDAVPIITNITGNTTQWTNKDVTLTISAEDSLVGLAEEPYSFDGGKTWQAENRKTYTSNSAGIIIKVRDKLGNIYTHDVIHVLKIDKYAPKITNVTGNPIQWTNKNVTLRILAGDSFSGLAEKPYSFDGGKTWQSENTKTYAKNTSKILIQVKDKAGNITTYNQTINIKKIDKTVPLITSVTSKSTSWKSKNVTLTINAFDSLSGLAEKAYSFDGGKTWQSENTKTYTKNPVGIIIKVKDKAGNVATYSTIKKLPKLELY